MVSVVPANPLIRRKIVKKRTNKFRKPQFDLKPSIPESWRKPKGIDGAVRRRYRGRAAMPKIGYGSNKETRHMLPNGLYNAVINNAKELEMYIMQNRKYCVTIAQSVGSAKRKAIVEKARVLGIHVTNAKARLRTEEAE